MTVVVWVFAATPSKVPFYLAGGALVCWAFGLAITGLTRPDVVQSARAARLVMGTSALLAGVTITTALATAGPPTEEPAPAPSPSPSQTLQLAADPSGQLAFDRTSAAVGAGEVTIRLTNESVVPHNVTIARGTDVVATTRTIERADAATTARLAAGAYVFYCSVPGHRQAGMRGTLTVR